MDNVSNDILIVFLTKLGYNNITILDTNNKDNYILIYYRCQVRKYAKYKFYFETYPIEQYNNYIRKQKLNKLIKCEN